MGAAGTECARCADFKTLRGFGQPQLSARASSSRDLVIKVVLCLQQSRKRVYTSLILQGKD